jgi:26S proteasome regulatory subunit N7
MAPYYRYLTQNFGIPRDDGLLTKLEEANKRQLALFEDQLKVAEANEGELEVQDALVARANYLCQIGEKDPALDALELSISKAVGMGSKLDGVFTIIRLGFFWNDSSLCRKNLERAAEMVEKGGDWERRNRLRVYRAYFCLSIREFEEASELFLSTLATFTSLELFSFDKFVFYAVIACMTCLERPNIKSKLLGAPEVQTVCAISPVLSQYLNSFYNLQYCDFFSALVKILDELRCDQIFASHFSFYSRCIRLRTYSQFLSSYRSVSLSSMAESFGVSVPFLDKELSTFIAAGRLPAKIDKVSGVVVTDRLERRNAQYQVALKKGDALLNRIQKLAYAVIEA